MADRTICAFSEPSDRRAKCPSGYARAGIWRCEVPVALVLAPTGAERRPARQRAMLAYMDILKPYAQYWFVTITPYGRDIEPNVPPNEEVMLDFIALSNLLGADSMGVEIRSDFVERYVYD